MTHFSAFAILMLAISGSLAQYVPSPNYYKYVTSQGGNTNGGNSQGSSNTQVGGSSGGGITIYGQGGSGGSQGGANGGGNTNTQIGGSSGGGISVYGQGGSGGSPGSTNGQTIIGGSAGKRIVISQNGNKNVYQIYPNQASYNCAVCKWCCVAKVPGQYVGTLSGGSNGGSLTIQTTNGGTNGGINGGINGGSNGGSNGGIHSGGINGGSTSGGSSGGSSTIVDGNNGNGNGYVAPPSPSWPNVPCVPSTTTPPIFPPGTTNPPIFPPGTTTPPVFPPGTAPPLVVPCSGTTTPNPSIPSYVTPLTTIVGYITPTSPTRGYITTPRTTHALPSYVTVPPAYPTNRKTSDKYEIPANPTNPNVPVGPGKFGCCQVRIHDIQATVSCGASIQGRTCCNSHTQITGGCGNSRSVTVQVSRNPFNIPPVISCQTALQFGIIRESDLAGVCSGGSIDVNVPTTVAPTTNVPVFPTDTVAPTISIPTVEPTVTVPVGPNQGSYVVPTGTWVSSSSTTASPISFFSAIVTFVIATVMCL